MRVLLVLLVFIAGCETLPPSPQPQPEAPPAPPPQEVPPPVVAPAPPPASREHVAVAGLIETARADAAAGKLSTAAASIERALRIEPRNPRLWQELARVRHKQGEYAQVEATAARSNSWAGSDGGLRAENWRLIAQAREARGDASGAKAALEQAGKLGR